MKRVNQYFFYIMGFELHPLATLQENQKVKDIAWDLNRARSWLEYLLTGKLVYLIVSRAAAQRLLDAINRVIPAKWQEFSSIDDTELLGYKVFAITSALEEFETVLAAELPTFDTYAVSQKGIYSTPDLIERAEFAIDESARNVISDDARSDFRQAGKCLAFELPTASGFHTMRAVEAVLRA